MLLISCQFEPRELFSSKTARETRITFPKDTTKPSSIACLLILFRLPYYTKFSQNFNFANLEWPYLATLNLISRFCGHFKSQ